MRVPQKFVVPWSRDWPEKYWEEKLGSIVSEIRRGNQHADKKKELEAAGFDFAKQANAGEKRSTGWEVVKAALLAYKALHGHLLVPGAFVVPSDDPHYPKSTWGVRLGITVHNIRNRGYYCEEHVQGDLRTMGFDFAK